MKLQDIIEEKRKLLLSTLESSLNQFDGSFTVNNNNSSFDTQGNERVQIIKFSDDNSKFETKISYVKIGNQIKKGSNRTCFELMVDNCFGNVIKIPNDIQLSVIETVNDFLKMELASLYAIQFNRLIPPEPISVNKPFLILFFERSPSIIGQGEPYLNPEMQKYDKGDTNDEINTFLPDAFSHFTYILSKSSLALTNLQKICYVFYDLQFLINNNNNTDNNNNNENFKDNHKCNSICYYLNFLDDPITFDINSDGSDKIKGEEYFRLGHIYYAGNNTEQAIKYYEKAEELNIPYAYQNHAIYYFDGRCGIEKDMKKTIKLLKKAGEFGQPIAYQALGCFYMLGDGVKMDTTKTLEYFDKSMELVKNNSFTLVYLGLMYYLGYGETKIDIKRAINYFKRAAEMNNSIGFKYLGKIYENDHDDEIQANLNTALEYFNASAQLGNISAYNDIGFIYQYGKCAVDIDIGKAIEYFQKSADRGDIDALCNLGFVHIDHSCKSDIHQLDVAKGIQLYEKAAELGSSSAYYCLGFIYKEDSENSKQDLDKALDCFLRAEELGDEDSLYNIAVIYEMKGSTKRALQYYQKSAKKGNLDAQAKLKSHSCTIM